MSGILANCGKVCLLFILGGFRWANNYLTLLSFPAILFLDY